MTDDTLQRFFDALVEALRERSPADLESPFTVAEIYQDLVPYRTHRDQLGVEMNGDYEFALLRLLAGEGGFLQLESEHALRDITAELEEKAPNTTVYRDFAAVDVRIDPFVLRSGGGDAPGKPGLEAAPATEESESRAEIAEVEVVDTDSSDSYGAALDDDSSVSGAPDWGAELAVVPDDQVESLEPAEDDAEAEHVDPSTPAGATSDEDGHCGWCRSELPAGRTVPYCPFCGQDQSLSPCRSCGDAMEPHWQFCITCGAQAAP